MTGLVFIWRSNFLERTVAAHLGPIFSLFSADNCLVTGAKEKYVFAYFSAQKWNPMVSFDHIRRSPGSSRVLHPLKVWDFDMTNGQSIKLDLPQTDVVCVRSVCRNAQVPFLSLSVRTMQSRDMHLVSGQNIDRIENG